MSILRNGLLPSISGKTDKFKELLDRNKMVFH